jgi:hypothetical protein
MRIHSRFKDYYDSVVQHGADPTLHYNRHATDVDAMPFLGFLPSWQDRDFFHDRRERGVVVNFFVVGFCGKLYPGARTTCIGQGSFSYVYDAEELVQLYFSASYERIFKRNKGEVQRIRERMTVRPMASDAFRAIEAPVFKVYTEYGDQRTLKVITNPFLRELEFYRVVDPYTAFQEISQYLGNELARQPETGDVPDKYKIAQHGFDKWSFRKLPQAV